MNGRKFVVLAALATSCAIAASAEPLPANIAAGATYYVISTGLSGSQFQVSTTQGGAAVNTTAVAMTFVNGNTTVTTSAAHNLVVGQIVRFAGASVVESRSAAGVTFGVMEHVASIQISRG